MRSVEGCPPHCQSNPAGSRPGSRSSQYLHCNPCSCPRADNSMGPHVQRGQADGGVFPELDAPGVESSDAARDSSPWSAPDVMGGHTPSSRPEGVGGARPQTPHRWNSGFTQLKTHRQTQSQTHIHSHKHTQIDIYACIYENSIESAVRNRRVPACGKSRGTFCCHSSA